MIFDHHWFLQHQASLRLFANTLLGRYILCLDQTDIGNKRVEFILPNAILWRGEGKKYIADIRTHDKFAKRLYFGLYPLWKTFHIWDTVFANSVQPSWNLGFDTTGNLYPAAGGNSPVDGLVRRSGIDEAFATIRGGAGTSAIVDGSIGDTSTYIEATATTNQYSQLRRGIFCFATGAVIPAGSTINIAVLSFAGSGKDNGLGSPNFDIVEANPAATNTLVAADYVTLLTTVFGSITYAGFTTTSAYIDTTLDANGRGNIETGGSNITKFGTRLSWDTANSFTGVWSSGAFSYLTSGFADTVGTGTDPKLVVTFTLPVGSLGAALLASLL